MSYLFKLGPKSYRIVKQNGIFQINGEPKEEVRVARVLGLGIRAAHELTYMIRKKKPLDVVMLADGDGVSFLKRGSVIEANVYGEQIALSFGELIAFSDQAYQLFQMYYPKNIRYDRLDPVFFSEELCLRLSDLFLVKRDRVEIDDLQVLNEAGEAVPLADSRYYRILQRKESFAEGEISPSTHLIETDGERLKKIEKSIKKFGYPMDQHYLVLYQNEMIVRDGKQRACVMKKLYGNETIDVLRFCFKKKNSVTLREQTDEAAAECCSQ